MVAGKNLFFTIIYTSHLIICASLKEIRPIVNEELMPQDLVDVCTDGRTGVRTSVKPRSQPAVRLFCPYVFFRGHVRGVFLDMGGTWQEQRGSTSHSQLRNV